MAKNREPEKTMESEPESPEEESGEASSEEVGSSESESEPEETDITKKPSSSPLAEVKKTQQQQQQPPSSSEEEESESESDSDGPDPNVRPIASKPIEDPQIYTDVVRKPRSKPGASGTVTSVKSAGAKRLAEEKESEARDAKRSRKKPESEIESSGRKTNDDSKKQLFQRLWSEDDEIVILKGMIDYVEKNKSDPVADLNAFHEFIKDNLHVDVTRTQLQDKIRRLKKKYENNKSKEKEGKDRTFAKPHEQKAYELSKHIWGNENGSQKVESTPRANGTLLRNSQIKRANAVENGEAEAAKNLEVVDVDVDKMSAAAKILNSNLNLEEKILRIGAELFEGDKNFEGSKEWRKLRMDEIEVYLKKVELMRAQTRLVLDVLKSSEY